MNTLMEARTYSTGEVAKQIGVSRQTLQAWIAKGIAKPKALAVGGATVRLWTNADIEKARKFKGTLKRGRKGKAMK